MYLILPALVAIPILEIYLLIQVGSEIGALPTIALSVLTALAGGHLARVQGFAVVARVRDVSARGELPALDLFDGALLLGAGLMLLLPGFFTDVLGALLLVPRLRRFLVARFSNLAPGRSTGSGDSGQRVIEGEFRRERR